MSTYSDKSSKELKPTYQMSLVNTKINKLTPTAGAGPTNSYVTPRVNGEIKTQFPFKFYNLGAQSVASEEQLINAVSPI